jgi:prevent-host-death family protein
VQKVIPITDLQRNAQQIVADLADESIVVTYRGRAAAVLVSVEGYAQIESDLKRPDELELAGMVKDARRTRTSNQTLSHEAARY